MCAGVALALAQAYVLQLPLTKQQQQVEELLTYLSEDKYYDFLQSYGSAGPQLQALFCRPLMHHFGAATNLQLQRLAFEQYAQQHTHMRDDTAMHDLLIKQDSRLPGAYLPAYTSDEVRTAVSCSMTAQESCMST